MTATEVSRRTLLKTAAFGVAGAALNLGAAGRAFAAKDLTVGVVYVGARDDFGWNQAHAVAIKALKEVPGVKVVEEENVPETDAVSKSMESMINLDGAGSHPRDLVRLLQTLRRRPRQEISGRRVPPCGAAVEQGHGPEERRLLFRLPQPGALCRRRGGGPVDQDEQARLRRRQADRQRAQQHQFVHARRAIGQPEGDRAGDLHRRLVAARPGGRVRQRAGRRRLRRHHLPRRRAEGGDRDGGKARASRAAATTPARRRSRPRASSPAPNTSGSRSTRATRRTWPRASRCPTSWPADTSTTTSRIRPFGAGASPEGQKAALAAIEGLKAKQADLCRAAQGQQDRQGRDRQDLRQSRSLPRQDGLPARGRRRLDDLKPERSDRPCRTRRWRPRPRATSIDPAASRAAGSDFAVRLRANSEYVVIPLLALAIAAALFAHLPHRDRQVAGRFHLLCLARRLRHVVLAAEHAAALGAADPDRARRRDPGPDRPDHDRRRGRARARRLRLRGARHSDDRPRAADPDAHRHGALRHGRRRLLGRHRRLPSLRARRQRDDLVAAPDLYRHRDHELLRRGRAARPDGSQQAVDQAARQSLHDRHDSRHRSALGTGVRPRALRRRSIS